MLGDQYGKVLEAGELGLQFDAALGTFHIAYYAERFPIAVRRYPPLLHSTANLLDRSGGPLFELADGSRRCSPTTGLRAGPCAGRRRSRSRRRWPRPRRDPAVRAGLDAGVAANGTLGLPESFQALHELLEDQAYRLAYWRSRARDQLPALFRHQPAGRPAHGAGRSVRGDPSVLLRLIAEGKVQGVRLDHIDGMYDPRGYCQRLLSRAADVLAEGATAHSP